MNHILDQIGIYVKEKDKTYIYKRIFTPDGIPNYYPPVDKNKLYSDMDIDEIMFFPIEMDTFNTDRKHKFYAYRYLFCSSGHTTISLGEDPLKLGWTYLQISVEVQRVRYSINKNSEIVIDKICDALCPPRYINIKDISARIGHTIQDVIQAQVMKFNEFYMNRNV